MSNQKIQVFLDLEETVIDSWGSGLLVNTEKVKNWLQNRNAKHVHIFSFAVWNDKDKQDFDRDFRNVLERVFDVTILTVPSVEELAHEHFRATGTRWESVTDFISHVGKPGGFEFWAEHRFAGDHCVLLDDVVPNKTVINHDNGTVIELVNITKLR